ncbi:hypothetical protein ABDK56_07900 [Sphingomonas sp. ASV193]|uniref:S53 family peptidase n=1 Tax=Sphingomonas sp. ASV193 TaxID=3144405 RepID=UPI0032E8BFE9
MAFAGEPVERSGNVLHQAVCARAIGRGEARCFAHVDVDARGNPFAGKAPTASPNVTPSGYGPADLRSAYSTSGTGGAGRTIAIVDAYGYPNAEADLAVYRAQYGLPACTTANGCFKVVNQSGGSSLPRYNSGWAQEQALDLDMASAMCQDCKILLVQASSASLANLAAAVNTAAATPGVFVISNSYGGGESGSSSYESAYNHPGIAVTVSTGDSGYGAQFPATSNHVIAVGGTNLKRASNARGWAETAWSSGSSGCSTVYAKPSYQSDSLCTMRMEADISAVGDPATGVAVYGPTGKGSQSGWLVFGGTSVSAPLIGGMYGASGKTANAASTIYADAAGGFNDVTSGTNGSCGGTYFCTAGAGYDGPTGRGTPIGSAGL